MYDPYVLERQTIARNIKQISFTGSWDKASHGSKMCPLRCAHTYLPMQPLQSAGGAWIYCSTHIWKTAAFNTRVNHIRNLHAYFLPTLK